MTIQNFYSEHSKTTDPQNYSYLFDDLDNNITNLTRIVQDLVMHFADEDMFRYYIPKNRYVEMDVRYVSDMLHLLMQHDTRSLNETRDPAHRMVGVCRDTSILLCALLRHKRIPARLRVGFCPYFISGIYLDGMCVEYWDQNKEKWCYVDTRTSPLHLKKFKLSFDFDLCDIPENLFISAQEAWALCRSNKLDANLFGSRQHRGLRFIQDRLIQELAVLNKKEVLLWDRWGMMLSYSRTSPSDDNQLAALDELSEFLLANSYDVNKLQTYYNQSPHFKIAGSVVIRNPYEPLKTIDLEI